MKILNQVTQGKPAAATEASDEPLPSFSLEASDGEADLGALGRDGPALLIFLRHFG